MSPSLPLLSSLLIVSLAVPLAGQAPATPGPEVKFRGGLWASAAASDIRTADGSLFLRSLDAGEGRFALDGLQLGVDVALPEGWAFRLTLLGGQDAKVLAAAGGETGSLTYPEAMLVWTGARDVVRIGRMYTFMGMEFMDHTQDVTASRGLLFTYAIPFDQVGLAWRHTFSPTWSTDAWLFNGENRIEDNNRGKTAGVGLNYNHGGSQEKYVSLMAYHGAEQQGPGAEGRKRTRLSALVGWAWGATSLAGEVEWARERFAASALAGATADRDASWSGAGVILKHKLDDRWAIFLRLEELQDDHGVVLSADTTLSTQPQRAYAVGADLRALSACLGAERRWGATFTRGEARWDRLNHRVPDEGGKAFQAAWSLTWSLGTSF
ncbi:MAG TPA: outer membrane beta-barrel protein [Holophagaceae bacterium]|nr:outer membrane beta-barrel protein [Holophagaceae bacterium]